MLTLHPNETKNDPALTRFFHIQTKATIILINYVMKYRSVQKYFMAFIMLFCTATSRGQQLQATLSHYSTDDGLASNAIAYITQDDYGYIWMATWNGLSRFDGYDFFNYRTGAGSHIPNLHNRISFLAIDNQQNVWLRMYDGRVFVLKRSIDKIIDPFEGVMGSEDYHTLRPITVTSSGYVLVNIEGVGLYKLRIESDIIDSELITTGGLVVTSMAEGYQNDIWLGTDKGVHRMDLSNLTIERKGFFLEEHITCLYSNGYNIFAGTQSGKIMSFAYGQEPKVIRNSGLSINALFVDSHGVIWFSDNRQGAIRIKPDTGDEKLFEQRVVVPDYDGSGGTFSETNGTVWVRMNHGGYGYYNRETDEVEYFHNDPANPWNLSNTVNASLALSEGVVWESTSRRGLEKLEILKKTIQRVQLFPEQGPSMANEIRTMLYDDARQVLLLGNKDNSLFFIHNDGSRTAMHNDSEGNPFGRTYGVSRGSKGDYWLCSKDHGVFHIMPQQSGYFVQNYCHSDQNKWSLNSNAAYYALEDKEGNVWVATFGGGVNILTKNKNGQRIALHKQNGIKNYPYNSHMKVRTLAIDSDDKVWAGTTDGILIMSYEGKKLSIQRLKPSQEDLDHPLMSNDIVCLAKDRQGNMWVGTNGGGLARTIGKDSKGVWLFENFGSKDGLPSEEIRSITFDDRGNAWFATDHVLCSYDTGKRIFTTFSNLDGVDETMCSEGAAVTLPNGNILFGTLNGYYLVDRSKLVNTAGNVLKLRITDFWLNDVLQTPRLNDSYNYYVPESKSVTLPSHSSTIAFRFASLNYQLQHRVHYQYMLEGYDNGWKNVDKSRIVSFKSLPTGTYKFKVKAFLLESPEKYDSKHIEVVVPPYFFFSSNSIWFYMIIATALGIWLLLWRQKRLEKTEKVRLLREGPRKQQQQTTSTENESDILIIVNDFLNVHFSDPMLTIEELATAADMSTERLAKQIKRETGLTAKEYLGEFRLKKALAMLEESEDTIAQIALNCGFSDPNTFNRHFKAITGITPSKYRDDKKNASKNDMQTDEYELIED